MNRPDDRARRGLFLRSGFALAAAAFCAGASASDPGREFVHTTAKGDTLISLAQRFLVDPTDWRSLQAANRIADPRAIPVGTRIRMPVSRMRFEPRGIDVEAVRGAAETESGKLAPGARLAEGAQVATGADGFVTLRLADGSRLTVPSASKVQVERSRTYGNATLAETVLRLLGGRVETEAKPQGGADRFEIRTNKATTGVRGTRFRVASLEGETVATEVIDGRVGVSGESPGDAIAVAGGFGTKVEAGRAPLPPVRLLGAPDVSATPALAERTLVRLPFGAVPGASAYRAQVALDPAFRTLVAEARLATPEARFADLPDGAYHLRVRAVDGLGLEGLDAVRAFRVKARPEPPFIAGPANRAKLAAPGAKLEWSASTGAATYRVQVSAKPDFATLALDEKGLASTGRDAGSLGVGTWHWRVASVRADGDQGPWSDARSFAVIPDPPQPRAGPAAGGRLAFEWGGEPGQRYQFQLAKDARFAETLVDRMLEEPKVAFDEPGAGEYYFRVRAVDADGFQGPFGPAQRLEVYPSPWWLLLLLVFVAL